MDDIYPLIALAILLLVALGWMFYSDKIVRFLGWVKEEDNSSWIFPSHSKKG